VNWLTRLTTFIIVFWIVLLKKRLPSFNSAFPDGLQRRLRTDVENGTFPFHIVGFAGNGPKAPEYADALSMEASKRASIGLRRSLPHAR